MRVLMFGWEFPPFKTGGLGTACYGLTRGLKHMGVEVIFVMPKSCGAEESEHVKVIGAKDIRIDPDEMADYTYDQSIEASEAVEVIDARDIRTDSDEMENYTYDQSIEASEAVEVVDAKDIRTDSDEMENYTYDQSIEASEAVEVIDARDIRAGPEETEDYTHVRLVKVNVPLSPYARPEQHLEVQEVWRVNQRKLTETSEPSDKVVERQEIHEKNPSKTQELRHERQREVTVVNKPSVKTSGDGELYGKSLFEEIEEYTSKAKIIAGTEKFDIIHAHDWMTFQAGIEARKVSGKPLVVHIHSTEYDRTGGWYPNSAVCDIEQTGAREADQVITVSGKTKRTIVENYSIPAEKISVVYNAIDADVSAANRFAERPLERKIVLFLGRMTLQKGPDYFLEAASKVLKKEPDVMFVMAGSGDMMYKVIERAGDLNIGHKVLFTGFLRGPEVDRMYDMADVYVMPSVSEPFGIAPLEAMSHGVPVIISRQSGVSEVIKHALKVDFWDVDRLADRIISVLRYRALRDMLGENGKSEMSSFSWDNSAIQCINIYSKILERTLPKRETPPSPGMANPAGLEDERDET
jgi:glycogen(starch) synthase